MILSEKEWSRSIKKKDGQQYDPFNEKLEMKLQKIFQKLSDKRENNFI